MKSLNFITVVVSLVVISSCVSFQKKQSGVDISSDYESFRLLPDVKPLRYELNLETYTSKPGFKGSVAIDFELQKARDYILLHAKDIKISNILLGSNKLGYKSINSADGLIKINFNRELSSGSYKIIINYAATYQQDLKGLYKINESGENYLFTQLEPISARKIFPSFDEPRFKTPFVVRITTEKTNHVISNNIETRKILEGNNYVWSFAETKPISTYLVALAVGPFDIVNSPAIKPNKFRRRELRFRGVATKGKGKLLNYALSQTPEILENLEKYFGYEYPFGKLDIIAVPDFFAGAMENVGAVTFRDWYLLLEPHKASVDQLRTFYLVMAHELAHMWFGNLVTMPWWNDLWLNEAFATWLSYKIIAQIRPEFETREKIIGRGLNAMKLELESARKIRNSVKNSGDIHNSFDGITYSKGGAFLAMLESYLGEEKFQLANKYYIKTHQFGSATSENYLHALNKFSSKNLITSAESFLEQVGVPNIKFNYTCDSYGFTLNLAQQRYKPLGAQFSANKTWSIPLCFGYEHNNSLKKHCMMLRNSHEQISIKSSCPKFIFPNFMGNGYFRFSLDKSDWNNLLKNISQLDNQELLVLADSLRSQFDSGNLDFGFVAEKLAVIFQHGSRVSAHYFLDLLKEANNYWINPEQKEILFKFSQEIITKKYQYLTKLPKPDFEQKLFIRDIAEFLAQIIKDPQTRNMLAALGAGYLDGVFNKIDFSATHDKNLFANGIRTALQIGDQKYINKLFLWLKDEKTPSVRENFLYGLAQSREADQGHELRLSIFKNPNLRQNERLGILFKHVHNPKNQPSTWEFVKNNYILVENSLGKSQLSYLPFVATGLCSDSQAQDVSKFFATKISGYSGAARNLARVVEEIKLCSARKLQNKSSAIAYFKKYQELQIAGQE